MELNLESLSVDNIGEWPLVIKLVIASVLGIILLVAGYKLSTGEQLKRLEKVRSEHVDFRAEFEKKQRYASSIQAYRKQLVEIRETFGHMLQKLPGTTEVPGLLEEISEIGNTTGLEFNLIKPLQEKQHDFYAELPIEISVLGSYHQFASFVSRLANIKRIVTLHDFLIQPVSAKESRQDLLAMQITAKTYRYLEYTKDDPVRSANSTRKKPLKTASRKLKKQARDIIKG